MVQKMPETKKAPKNRKVPPIVPNPDRKETVVNLNNLSLRLKAKREDAYRRANEY